MIEMSNYYTIMDSLLEMQLGLSRHQSYMRGGKFSKIKLIMGESLEEESNDIILVENTTLQI